MAAKSQRAMMRDLHSRYDGDAERIIREYAAAEERGEVGRASDRYGLTAQQYARALWSDAVRKGWLGSTQASSFARRSPTRKSAFDTLDESVAVGRGEHTRVADREGLAPVPRGAGELPIDRIGAAVAAGQARIRAAGFEPEGSEVAVAVERHRWAWKADRVRVLLLAESHVYTTPEDFALRVRTELLPSGARHAPAEYVRLVYCLGYGESGLLTGTPPQGNGGTPQFWNIFGRLAGTGRQPATRVGQAARLRWKVDTLDALRAVGVWLLDTCLHAVYTPGGTRLDRRVIADLHALWWRHYGAWLFEQHADTYRCVIGPMTAGHLTPLGVRFDNWIYQPQGTRNVPIDNRDRGWPELLAAVARG